MVTPIVSILDLSLTTSVNNIEHIESQSLNGVVVVRGNLAERGDSFQAT